MATTCMNTRMNKQEQMKARREIAMEKYQDRKKELEVFLKCCKGSSEMFNKLCQFGLIDASNMNGCCVKVDEYTMYRIAVAIQLQIIDSDMEIIDGEKIEKKIFQGENGYDQTKMNQWYVEIYGPRYFELDTKLPLRHTSTLQQKGDIMIADFRDDKKPLFSNVDKIRVEFYTKKHNPEIPFDAGKSIRIVGIVEKHSK